MILPGLVLYQPYAWAMFHGKDVENRPRRTRHRGPLLILAAAKTPSDKYIEALTAVEMRGLTVPPREELAAGGIIGAVEIWDLQPPVKVSPGHLAPYQGLKWHFPEQWGWLARKPVELPFRRYRGHQGMMRIEITNKEKQILTENGLLAA